MATPTQLIHGEFAYQALPFLRSSEVKGGWGQGYYYYFVELYKVAYPLNSTEFDWIGSTEYSVSEVAPISNLTRWDCVSDITVSLT